LRHETELEGPCFRLRRWRRGDETALQRYANNRKVWINLTDRFPHPYGAEAARWWIDVQESGEGPEYAFAIELDGEAVGGIGVSPGQDLGVKTAEIGYWLGEPFWGRGIATQALRLLTGWAFAAPDLDLVRIHAHVLAWNPASARVLEKAGYECEACLRKSVYKDGQVIDSLLYATLRQD